MNAQSIAPETGKTSLLQTICRIWLGISLLFAGFSHLTFARVEFLAQVPTWLPVDGDLVVVLSGVVELILGAALILMRGKYRRLTGWVAAVFFIAIFPGNISQYVNHIDAFGLDTDQARLIRLFFQPLLVVWAVWATGAWQSRRKDRPNSSRANRGAQ